MRVKLKKEREYKEENIKVSSAIWCSLLSIGVIGSIVAGVVVNQPKTENVIKENKKIG